MKSFATVFSAVFGLYVFLLIPISATAQTQFVQFKEIPLTDLERGSAHSVAWGDYDNDGDEDLLQNYGIENRDDRARLYRNDSQAGTIRFTNVTDNFRIDRLGRLGGAAWGDFDNDGFLDLLLGGEIGERSKLYRNSGGKVFNDVTSAATIVRSQTPRSVAWADYNNDGFLDFSVAGETPAGVQLFRNLGDNTFIEVSAAAGLQSTGVNSIAIWADYDNDGDLDLYAGSGDSDLISNFASRLYRNDGPLAGTFTEVSAVAGINLPGSNLHASWIDYDNDGFMDLFVANGNTPQKNLSVNRLYHNNGNGTFTDRALQAGLRGAGLPDSILTHNGLWADFDNDGDPDLFASTRRGETYRNYFYVNRGDGSFGFLNPDAGNTTIAGIKVTALGSAAAIDVDADGFLDVIVPQYRVNNDNLFYKNAKNNNHWLAIKLIGVKSNRSAIGGRVELFVDGRRQTRQVEGGGRSQDTLPVEFGLGSKTRVDSLVVRWPSGQLQVIVNLSRVDTFLTITESSRPPLFTNVTLTAGGEPLLNLRAGSGMAWGDYDNDDRLDLFIVNGSFNPRGQQRDKLFRNLGNGKFFEETRSRLEHAVIIDEPGTGAAWGDYDNDGDLDVYVTGDGASCRLFRNLLAESGAPNFIEAADSAGVANSEGAVNKATSGLWADYDRDGYLDLLVTNQNTKNRLYHNNGNGTFTDVAERAFDKLTAGGNGRAAWADFDNDGDLDLYLANFEVGNQLFRNDGGRFTEVATQVRVAGDLGDRSSGIAWGDYNNDGHLDLFVHSRERTRLYKNDGRGNFDEVTGASYLRLINRVGETGSWVDYDQDGFLDLYVVNSTERNVLFHNNQNGTFTNTRDLLSAVSGKITATADGVDAVNGVDAAWGDYDGDGDLEVYVVRTQPANADTSILFNNTLHSDHRWLIVKAVGSMQRGLSPGAGRRSNRSGIGARIRAAGGNLIQIREVEGGANNSQNSLPVEFGFGSQISQIDTLLIRWPNGLTKTLLNVATNQFLTVNETAPQLDLDKDSLNFGVLAVKSVAMQKITLRNAGDGDLNVRQILASNKIFAVDRQSFRLLQGQAIDIQVRCTPDSAKLESGTLTILNDDPSRPAFAVRVQVNGRDINPPEIVFDLASLQSQPPRENRPLIIRPLFKDDLQVQSTRLFYRNGGGSAFDSTFMSLDDPARNLYIGKIPAEAITNRGLEFYFVVSDGANLTTSPAHNPQTNPFAAEVDVDNIKKPAPQPAGKYRMFSIPLRLNDPEISFEPYDRMLSRVFVFTNGRYVEYGASGFPKRFVPARAFFLIARNETRLETGAGLTVTTGQPFELVLAPGWNMIGVPWNFRLSWSRAEKPNEVWRSLYGYDDGGFNVVDILEPGEGYLAYNYLNADSLKVKLLPSEAMALQTAKHYKLARDEWRLMLQAHVSAQWDSANYLGMLNTAADEWDVHDAPEPPPIGGYVSLRFPHSDWNYAGDYSADYRAVSAHGAYWDFELRSNLADPNAELCWRGIKEVPDFFEILLVDRRLGQVVDMRRTARYTCLAGAAPTSNGAAAREPRFRLIIGKPAFVQTHAEGLFGIPADFALRQNFPNPFRSLRENTVIRYELPNEVKVRLVIFDVLGRKVIDLVDGTQPAGYHGVAWNGKEATGQLAATGIYFYRFQAGDFVQMRKILLIR